MKSAKANDGQELEAECQQLLLGLGFESVVRLAKGADRGKDLVCDTRLCGEPADRRYRIFVECKDTGRSVAFDAIRSKLEWALAEDVDALIVATRGQFSAGLVDWIHQTKDKRQFPVLLWDGDTLTSIANAVSSGCQERLAILEAIASQIRAYTGRNDAGSDWCINARSTLPLHAKSFVNRNRELQALTAFDTYRTAIITGPSGCGKSQLLSAVAESASRRRMAYVYVDCAHQKQDTLWRLVVANLVFLGDIAACAAIKKHLDSFGWLNVNRVIELATDAIVYLKPVLLVDNLPTTNDDSTHLADVQQLINTNQSGHTVIATSQIHTPQHLAIQGDVILSVGRLKRDDISLYLSDIGLDDVDTLLGLLDNEFEGWPLAMGLLSAWARGLSQEIDWRKANSGSTREDFLAEALSIVLAQLPTAHRQLMRVAGHSYGALSMDGLSVILNDDSGTLLAATRELTELGLLENQTAGFVVRHPQIERAIRNAEEFTADEHAILAAYFATRRDSADDLAAAMEHLIKAKKWDEAIRLLDGHTDRLVRSGLSARIAAWSELILSSNISLIDRMRIQLVQSRALEFLGQYEAARIALSSAEALGFGTTPDLTTMLKLKYRLMRVDYFDGRYLDVLRTARFVFQRVRQEDSPLARQSAILYAATWEMVGRVRFARSQWHLARRAYHQARLEHGRVGHAAGLCKIQHRFAMLDHVEGNIEAASVGFRSVLQEANRLKDRKREAYALHRLGEIARRDQDFDKALDYHRRSLEVKVGIGHRRGLVFSHAELARTYLAVGSLQEAATHADKAWMHACAVVSPKEEATVAILKAILAKQAGDAVAQESWQSVAEARFLKIGLHDRARAAAEGEFSVFSFRD